MDERRGWRRLTAGLVAMGLGCGGLSAGIGSCVRAQPPPAPLQSRFAPVSRVFQVEGRPLRVHALPCGYVQIKECHARGCLPEGAPYLARFGAILGDRRFAEPSLPIWVYAIEHPDGLVLVDTGHDPAYYDAATWAPDRTGERLIQSFIRIDATAAEALPARLEAVGLADRPVAAVVLTHQHVDHTGSVRHFDGVPVWTARAEVRASSQIGALPWRWQTEHTTLRFVDDDGTRTDVLGASRPAMHLTGDGRLRAVVVGGHTPGSLAVELRTDDGPVWFVGDVAFDVPGIEADAPLAGIHTAPADVRAVHEGLRDSGALLLAAHDPDVPDLLASDGDL